MEYSKSNRITVILLLIIFCIGFLMSCNVSEVYGVSKKIKSSQTKLIKKAKTKLGCKYVYGASGSRSFDCSGFVYWVYKNAKIPVKKKIIRTSCHSMYYNLKKYKVSNKLHKARKGDIILYKNGSRYTHTAISLGNNKMIHASSGRGRVCIVPSRYVTHSSVAIIRVLK